MGCLPLSGIPWQRPRAELLLLLLIAAVTLSPVAGYDEQDSSRICLSRALVAGRLSNDGCFAYTVDRSVHDGHLYSNKAPGMSVIEIAPAEAVRLASPVVWTHKADLRLWIVHLVASGYSVSALCLPGRKDLRGDCAAALGHRRWWRLVWGHCSHRWPRPASTMFSPPARRSSHSSSHGGGVRLRPVWPPGLRSRSNTRPQRSC